MWHLKNKLFFCRILPHLSEDWEHIRYRCHHSQKSIMTSTGSPKDVLKETEYATGQWCWNPYPLITSPLENQLLPSLQASVALLIFFIPIRTCLWDRKCYSFISTHFSFLLLAKGKVDYLVLHQEKVVSSWS